MVRSCPSDEDYSPDRLVGVVRDKGEDRIFGEALRGFELLDERWRWGL